MIDRINSNSDSRLPDHTDRVTTDLCGVGDLSGNSMASGAGLPEQRLDPSENEYAASAKGGSFVI